MYCRIAEHWHINANPSKPDFLVPTRFSLKSKHGTKLLKVTYPKHKTLKVAGFDESYHVYDGTIVIYGIVEVPEKAAGKTEELELIVNYQACNEQTCLRPTKIVLGGKLKVAAAGETVREINQEKFAPPRTAEKTDDKKPSPKKN